MAVISDTGSVVVAIHMARIKTDSSKKGGFLVADRIVWMLCWKSTAISFGLNWLSIKVLLVNVEFLLTGFRVSPCWKIKSSQIARECMSSSVGYRSTDHTIASVIVNRDSNEKQVFKAGDNNVIDVTSPALNTSQREMPMLGIERQSAR